jgi:hypothetical protein
LAGVRSHERRSNTVALAIAWSRDSPWEEVDRGSRWLTAPAEELEAALAECAPGCLERRGQASSLESNRAAAAEDESDRLSAADSTMTTVKAALRERPDGCV